MNDIPSEQTIIAGLKTQHVILGEGTPVLALHGWGASSANFWPVAQGLAPQGYRVYVPDLPGFGGTQAPPEPWGVPEYAAWVLAYLDGQDIAQTHLLGHSFGGRISLILGADHADRLDKLVLANSAGVPTQQNPLRTGAVRAAKAVFSLPVLRAFYEPLRQRYSSDDYRQAGALRETFLKVISQDLLPYAARVARPTLLIWGDQDSETALWQGRKLEATIPDAGLVVFKGAGHFSYLERLPDYLRIVQHFLSQDDTA